MPSTLMEATLRSPDSRSLAKASLWQEQRAEVEASSSAGASPGQAGARDPEP